MSAKEPTQNPYLFVVGCPRSGTTLLQRMLDAHPDLAVANDSHFILETLADFAPLDPLSGIDLDPALTRDLVEWVRTYRTFGRLGLDDRAVVMRTLAVASDTLSIRQIARSFAQGKAVEKRVALTILALARLGHVASPDGGDTFVLRRVA